MAREDIQVIGPFCTPEAPLKPQQYTVSWLHQAILECKTKQDKIDVMRQWISAQGGWSNAPREVFDKLGRL